MFFLNSANTGRRLTGESANFKWFGKYWDLAFARLEEQPLRILVTVLTCVIFGSAVFWPMQAHFGPTNAAAYNTVNVQAGKSIAYPKFQPVVYALENVLPVVKLGQDDHWAPDAGRSSFRLYWTLMFVRWFLIMAGYIQGLILAAALSTRFRN